MSKDIIKRKKFVLSSLVKNEMIKLYSSKMIFIIVSLILVGVILLAIMIDSKPELIEGDGRETLEMQTEELKGYFSGDYGFSANGREYYMNCIKVNEYMLENNIMPIKTHSIGNLVLSLNQMFAIIVIITILGAGKLWSDEFEKGTLVALVSRPVSRKKIFVSKFVTLVSLSFFVELLLCISTIIIGGAFWGFDGLNDIFVSYSNGIVEKNFVEQIMYYSFYNFFTLLACTVVTSLLVIIIKNGVIATSISIMFYVVGSSFVLALGEYEMLKYSLLANIQFQIYLDGNEIFSGMTPNSSIMNVLIHITIMILIAIGIFVNRNADE